jgi:3-dehydroquinate dehydratase/shikimate dehydrogenase
MIIVSITGPTMAGALAQIGGSAPFADALEFRLDLIRSPELAVLMLSTRKPVIATCRTRKEGGGFDGTPLERMEMLRAASLLGADFVDMELRADRLHLGGFVRRTRESQVIVSLHLKRGERFVPAAVYRRMRATGADVLKIAYPAEDAWEIALAAEFLGLARRDRQKAIAMAMGPAGEPSRILYRVMGGWGTFASTEDGKSSAPGQIPGSVLKTLYGAGRLGRRTKVFGVIGHPVSHSKGIYIHNPLFRAAGADAVYCRFDVRDLGRFMRRVAPMMQGLSVTLPHKQQIMRHLSRIDPAAKAIGAVNTVVRRGKGFVGVNTDAPGALDAIERVVPVAERTVLILGAGGAARAIAFEALRRGAKVILCSRKASRARALAAELNATAVSMNTLPDTAFDILVNATPVGMAPHANRSPVPTGILGGKVVFDAVYTPSVTRLLKEALAQGAKIVPGTEMYLNQAAMQSRLYAGVVPDRRLMKRLLDAQPQG